MTPTTAADVMTPCPLTVAPDTPLVHAIGVMVDHRVRHLPVVDATKQLVGMLSERDVRTAIGDPTNYARDRRHAPAMYLVENVMSRPAIAVHGDRPVPELACYFADSGIGALPVVDDAGTVVGIVSYVDALRALCTTAPV
jgi:CBS-domain-containing membrane protein